MQTGNIISILNAASLYPDRVSVTSHETSPPTVRASLFPLAAVNRMTPYNLRVFAISILSFHSLLLLRPSKLAYFSFQVADFQ